jgi:hypothetical protein
MFDSVDADPDTEFIGSIAPDVMKCLVRDRFFEKLDDLLSPQDESISHQKCSGDYKHSESVLLDSGFQRTDLGDIFAVLRFKGGYCDCEVLYNVAETSRLKAQYWRSRSVGQEYSVRHLSK